MFQYISSEKKWNLLKIVFLGPVCTKKGSLWATPKTKNNFYGKINKSRSSAFRNLLFSWVMFFVKKMSFPVKTADTQWFQACFQKGRGDLHLRWSFEVPGGKKKRLCASYKPNNRIAPLYMARYHICESFFEVKKRLCASYKPIIE